MRVIAVYTTLLFITVANGVGCAPPPAGAGRITDLDVEAVLEPDGDLAVVETLEVSGGADGRIGLTRVIDSEFADAAIFGSFEVEGTVVASGAELAVMPTRDEGLAITWSPTADAQVPATVRIAYVLERVAAVNHPRGYLEWALLSSGHAHTVGDVRVTLDLPAGTRFYEGTGVGQPGWTVVVADGHFEATRAAVAEGEAATLLAVFDVDRSQVQQSRWEHDLDVRSEYFYALVSAGLFIGIVGVGVLIILRLQYPPLAEAPPDRRAALAADRRMVSQGLRTTAIASLALAGVLAAAAAAWLSGLGVAVHSIPGSIAAVAVLFLIASWWYGRGA